jgi:hypothetical protein
MTTSAISFVAWAVFMLIALAAIVWTAKKNRASQDNLEDAASACLPEIGKIAENKHKARFGRAATNAPGSSDDAPPSWYPEAKRKVAKHG